MNHTIMKALEYTLFNKVPVLFPELFNVVLNTNDKSIKRFQKDVKIEVTRNIITVPDGITDGWWTISNASDIQYREPDDVVTEGPRDVLCNSAILNQTFKFKDNKVEMDGYAGLQKTTQNVIFTKLKIDRCIDALYVGELLKDKTRVTSLKLNRGIFIYSGNMKLANLIKNDKKTFNYTTGVVFYFTINDPVGEKLIDNIDQTIEDFLLCCYGNHTRVGTPSIDATDFRFKELDKGIMNNFYYFNYIFEYEKNIENFTNYNNLTKITNLKFVKPQFTLKKGDN